jgi:pyrroline-5-carboxylate reductase
MARSRPLMCLCLQAFMRLLLIGGGNMGSAIVQGVLARRVLTPREVTVVEIDKARREIFAQLGCAVAEDAAALGAVDELDADVQVVLAVKPQMFADVARDLMPVTKPRVFISIMAGLDSGRMHRALGPAARVVRCMPNVACQIGQGMTAIALGMGAREGDEDLARQIFDALGKTVMVDESLMHAVTAVSGSGPAYVFLMAEAMQKAAEAVDLPADVAKALVTQTILGAAHMLSEKDVDAPALRQSVTSRGGTTEAALRVFEHEGFQRIVIDAIRAARDRGIELNG